MCEQDGYGPEKPEPVRALRVKELDAGTSWAASCNGGGLAATIGRTPTPQRCRSWQTTENASVSAVALVAREKQPL